MIAFYKAPRYFRIHSKLSEFYGNLGRRKFLGPGVFDISYPLRDDDIGEFRITSYLFESFSDFSNFHIFGLRDLSIAHSVTIHHHSFRKGSIVLLVSEASKQIFS